MAALAAVVLYCSTYMGGMDVPVQTSVRSHPNDLLGPKVNVYTGLRHVGPSNRLSLREVTYAARRLPLTQFQQVGPTNR